MEVKDKRLFTVWIQRVIPVILRRDGKGERLRFRLPYAENNRAWLQYGRRNSTAWIASEKYCEDPKAWFNDQVNRLSERYSNLYIIQPFREQEKFAPAYWNARMLSS